MKPRIGAWVERERGSGLAHLTESVVDGSAIVRCGKRLRPETSSGGPLVEVEPVTYRGGGHGPPVGSCAYCAWTP